MKYISIFIVVFVCICAGYVQGADKTKFYEFKDELAKQGCCSWHGGVCSCQGNRTVCCDGSYSPSCTCYHELRKNDTLENKGYFTQSSKEFCM